MPEGQTLVVCEMGKTLGIVLNQELIFSDYVAHVIHQSFGTLRGLYRLRNLSLKPAKVHHMQSVILSDFTTATLYVRVATERILKLPSTAVRYSHFDQ
ncbi:hypothetical protein J6590_093556, partial [Homalodisca vitripennis]